MEAASFLDPQREFDESLIPHVARLVREPVREHVQGSMLTTFAIGGIVRAVVTVSSVQEVSDVLTLLHREGQGARIIGNGSNLLLGDDPLAVWMMKLGGDLRKSEAHSSTDVEVGGATSLMSFSRKVSDSGLSGLEFAAGIPATIGGATYMNAGAHGGELCAVIKEIRAVLPDGSAVGWSRNELPWQYRSSGIPAGAIVTSIRCSLVEGDRDEISRLCSHNLAERRARQPLSLPSAGSVFKNPTPELSAGKVLEDLGLKGFTIGGASISELHANWIVNRQREATARDVLQVIETCRSRALLEAGVVLEPEVRVWV